ncbi:hypothetical protein [Streptomyces sp. Y1]|uniref:Uncharacterized protein n=1 Tax=Streptomyces sp. Y1 TaxID=3238634 RepID=A0AB39TWA4_9ACTN
MAVVMLVFLVLAMFTVLAWIGLSPDSAIALGGAACVAAAELIRRIRK